MGYHLSKESMVEWSGMVVNGWNQLWNGQGWLWMEYECMDSIQFTADIIDLLS